MSIFFSRQCEYALQAILYLALKPQGETASIREMTSKLDIPYHFLAKILQSLTHKGLLRSTKGHAGGFALNLPVTEITMFNIVEAIDGVKFMNGCLLGFHECSQTNPCALHEQWGVLRESIHSMLVSKNVEQMAHKMQKPEYGW